MIVSRPRRNRRSSVIRDMIAETRLTANDFIYPMFLTEGKNSKEEIKSMPGIYRFGEESILPEIETCLQSGLRAIALFPNLNESLKDSKATQSTNFDGLYLRTIRAVKSKFPELLLMTDVAMDPYSSDGHDGLVKNGVILNDETLPILSEMALAQAECGADLIGPSDMMDGRVGFIRQKLDEKGFTETGIISYTAKYASAFYGPFRDALNSAPRFGDKKTYQMNPANVKEALRELNLDENEGADFVMIKPALAYLDVIKSVSEHTNLPVAAYQVSGEYAMIKAAGQNGWLDEDKVRDECLLAIKRAGADVILSYFAKDFVQSL